MEPAIRDGVWCLLRSPVESTRQGKIVLIQLRDAIDPETGQRYTVKRYKNRKVTESNVWHPREDHPQPANPAFERIVLSGADEGELRVIAALIEVLAG